MVNNVLFFFSYEVHDIERLAIDMQIRAGKCFLPFLTYTKVFEALSFRII